MDPDRGRPTDPPASAVLGAVALGGGIGALGRAGLAQLLPHPAGGLDTATIVSNVLGSLLLGALLVLVSEQGRGRPLLRPFVGTGVLGGFTTFSTYAVHARGLASQHPLLMVGELLGTVVSCVAAVALGVALARRWGRS